MEEGEFHRGPGTTVQILACVPKTASSASSAFRDVGRFFLGVIDTFFVFDRVTIRAGTIRAAWLGTLLRPVVRRMFLARLKRRASDGSDASSGSRTSRVGLLLC